MLGISLIHPAVMTYIIHFRPSQEVRGCQSRYIIYVITLSRIQSPYFSVCSPQMMALGKVPDEWVRSSLKWVGLVLHRARKASGT